MVHCKQGARVMTICIEGMIQYLAIGLRLRQTWVLLLASLLTRFFPISQFLHIKYGDNFSTGC